MPHCFLKKISVIIALYRGERTLAGVICSVLGQNIGGLEVIVLDNGSFDAFWQIVNSIDNTRLVSVRHHNRGLAATLNSGISLANGHFIVRLDQDELVLSGRLAKQVSFLDANPDVAMVGTWGKIYPIDDSTERYHRSPAANEALQLELLFDHSVVHSPMLILTDLLSVSKEMLNSISRTGHNAFVTKVVRIVSDILLTFVGLLMSRVGQRVHLRQKHFTVGLLVFTGELGTGKLS